MSSEHLAVLLALAVPLAGQNPVTPRVEVNVETVKAAMRDSLLAQRNSVQRQFQSVRLGTAKRSAMASGIVFDESFPSLPAADSTACAPFPSERLNQEIQSVATSEGVSADLLQLVVDKESAASPCAISSKGAMGLMQLMPATAVTLGVTNPFDPVQNLRGGAKYLGQLLSKYGGDLRLALSAYNAGPARVDLLGDVPRIPETQNYIKDILGKLNLSMPASVSSSTPEPAPLPGQEQ